MLSAVRAGDSAAVSADFRRRWDARLDLRFKYEGERTRLVRRRHVGPLVVQRPFHPEPGGPVTYTCCILPAGWSPAIV